MDPVFCLALVAQLGISPGQEGGQARYGAMCHTWASTTTSTASGPPFYLKEGLEAMELLPGFSGSDLCMETPSGFQHPQPPGDLEMQAGPKPQADHIAPSQPCPTPPWEVGVPAAPTPAPSSVAIMSSSSSGEKQDPELMPGLLLPLPLMMARSSGFGEGADQTLIPSVKRSRAVCSAWGSGPAHAGPGWSPWDQGQQWWQPKVATAAMYAGKWSLTTACPRAVGCATGQTVPRPGRTKEPTDGCTESLHGPDSTHKPHFTRSCMWVGKRESM